jgi:hypothetical protein
MADERKQPVRPIKISRITKQNQSGALSYNVVSESCPMSSFPEGHVGKWVFRCLIPTHKIPDSFCWRFQRECDCDSLKRLIRIEGPMTIAITRTEFSADELRREAKRSRDASQSRRLLALASILEGAPRSEAARLAGMDRQTLADWVTAITPKA